MIHSLSGGVIKGGGSHRIVKAGGRWFLSDEFAVSVGDTVLVEIDGKITKEKVSDVKLVDETISPIRIKFAPSVINVAFD